jgi:hypothetical protein
MGKPGGSSGKNRGLQERGTPKETEGYRSAGVFKGSSGKIKFGGSSSNSQKSRVQLFEILLSVFNWYGQKNISEFLIDYLKYFTF